MLLEPGFCQCNHVKRIINQMEVLFKVGKVMRSASNIRVEKRETVRFVSGAEVSAGSRPTVGVKGGFVVVVCIERWLVLVQEIFIGIYGMDGRVLGGGVKDIIEGGGVSGRSCNVWLRQC